MPSSGPARRRWRPPCRRGKLDLDRALALPDATRQPLVAIRSFFEPFGDVLSPRDPGAARRVGVDAVTLGGGTLQNMRGDPSSTPMAGTSRSSNSARPASRKCASADASRARVTPSPSRAPRRSMRPIPSCFSRGWKAAATRREGSCRSSARGRRGHGRGAAVRRRAAEVRVRPQDHRGASRLRSRRAAPSRRGSRRT